MWLSRAKKGVLLKIVPIANTSLRRSRMVSISYYSNLREVWPTTLCHVINKDSPLYEYTASSLLSAQFEIICLLEGIVESTGMTAQAKTSYLPCEILWGHRFRKLVTYQRSNGSYQIDYNLFNSTYAVKTPHCSAMEHYAQNCSKTSNRDSRNKTRMNINHFLRGQVLGALEKEIHGTVKPYVKT
ncbi:inward rectifier potassium channel [Oesophagostomum dentatum]|uniref:Inward rectifier potassium channel n=1 Tax=Oesophagostomum dentatum TaxID=61180 RepID=A0A0B1S2P7_OESDE|nr:inward rectifier potassium channel [Oesophagostomum dentatum]